MCRHPPNRAGAIAEQHIISDPDRDLLFIRWINGMGAGKNAGLFLREFRSFKLAFAGGLLAIFADRRPLLLGHDEIDKWMFRREHQESSAIKRVRPGCKHPYFLFVLVDLEIDFRAFAFSDPISTSTNKKYGCLQPGR